MSRSYRHHNIMGFAGTSERWDKKSWHQKMRAKCKQICSVKIREDDFFATDFPLVNEIINPWMMLKDGKTFFEPAFVDAWRVSKWFTKDGKLRK